MCIVSGRTHILFDPRYRMRLQASLGNEERRIIAFNKSNDLRRRPDGDCIRCLDNPFPATLISVRFYMDRDNLRRIGGRQ